MGNFNINSKSYTLTSTGKVEVKPITSVDAVKADYHDDIVIKNKQNQLLDIRADELDVNGSWINPYVGLPKAGDTIKLVDESNTTRAEGQVVFAEDENDAMTYTQKAMAPENLKKKASEVVESTKTLAKETSLAIQAGSQKLSDAVEQQVQPKPKAAEAVEDGIKEVRQGLKEIKNEIVPPTPQEKVRDAVNTVTDKTAQTLREAVRQATGKTMTFGQTETFQKGDAAFGISIGKNATVNANYTLGVSNLGETLRPMGGGLLNEPHSETYFLAHSAETRLGGDELSVGYKANLGVEFNRPGENDFSVSAVGVTSVGQRPGGGAFLGMGLGVEGRYELSKTVTLYGGPIYRGTLVGDAGPGAGMSLDAGVKIRF